MNNLPSLPYNNSSGWSGSEASKERAEEADSSGKTRDRQTQALQFITDRQEEGVTWYELAEFLGIHHGIASGVLSNLHKAGLIERLVDKRGKSHIYVHPAYTGTNFVSPYKASKQVGIPVDDILNVKKLMDNFEYKTAHRLINGIVDKWMKINEI